MATTTLEQCDAYGAKHKFKYTIDVDGVTLIPTVDTGSGGGGGTTTPPEALPSAFTVLPVTVGITALRLTATATPCKTPPIVKADPKNTGLVYVITSSGGTAATGFPLAAGDVAVVPVDDLSEIWLIADVASQKASALAGV